MVLIQLARFDPNKLTHIASIIKAYKNKKTFKNIALVNTVGPLDE